MRNMRTAVILFFSLVGSPIFNKVYFKIMIHRASASLAQKIRFTLLNDYVKPLIFLQNKFSSFLMGGEVEAIFDATSRAPHFNSPICRELQTVFTLKILLKLAKG